MAGGFAEGAAMNLVGNLATEYASPYVAYFFRYGQICREFKTFRHRLEHKYQTVGDEVIKAQRQNWEIYEQVPMWQLEARKEVEEAGGLAGKIERGYKCWCCTSLGWRYFLSVKLAKKNKVMSSLLERSNDFPPVGRPKPLQGIEPLIGGGSMDGVKLPESSQLVLEGIWKAFKKDVSMIGVHGMGGVGKTTLAEQVAKKAGENGFGKVVFSTVSQPPRYKEFQDRIAEIFGLKDSQALTEDGRLEELHLRLKNRSLKEEENILIIGDDVWEEIDLQKLGIPPGWEDVGIKVVITTRDEAVCKKMGCRKEGEDMFKIETLPEGEAWALFKYHAGLQQHNNMNDASSLNDIAEEVARECKGLPLAIVTIAKSLKGESLDQWREAHDRLIKDSKPLVIPGVLKGLYGKLKLSYDFLKDENIQSCFLLCSLYPEDWDISIESLTMCAIGQGLFSETHDEIERLRRNIRIALTTLEQRGLLLESKDQGYVKMHDVFRDFAHWMTSHSRGENRIFMVKQGLKKFPVQIKSTFDCLSAISLWNCRINGFPDNLKFSKLKTLILARTGNSNLNVPSAFFEGMDVLRVLVLEQVVFPAEACQFLTNLRTLSCRRCKLKNVSSLGKLTNLEILILLYNHIMELPAELEELQKLKILYFLEKSDEMMKFSPDMLSRLKSLQELYVTDENNMNLRELNSMSDLAALTLRVDSKQQGFPANFVFPNLSWFNIAVNARCFEEDKVGEVRPPLLRRLKICDENFSSSSLVAMFKELCYKVEVLIVIYIKNLKNLVPNAFDYKRLEELKSLQIYSCDTECLIDTAHINNGSAFSNVVELRIKRMPYFTEWCRGGQVTPTGFLDKLEILEAEHCKAFPSRGVISASGLPTFLKQVSFSHCRGLQTVFPIPKDEGGKRPQPLLSNLGSVDLNFLPDLEMIWELVDDDKPTPQQPPAVSLQCLREVTVLDCNNLKYPIFPPCLASTLCNLQKLSVSDCKKLEQVFGFEQEQEQADQENHRPAARANLTELHLSSLPNLSCIWKGPTHLVNLGSLRSMTIYKCNKLAGYLFSPSLAQTLKHLEDVTVHECPSLECLILESELELDHKVIQEVVSESSNREGTVLCSLPKLKTLKIISCESLKYVFPVLNMAQARLPCLESLKVKNCQSLKYVFPVNMAQAGLTCLKSVEIHNCGSLEYLFPELNMVQAALMCLESVNIMECQSLKYVFPVNMTQVGITCLKSVEIHNCESLEYVFQLDKIVHDSEENQAPVVSNLTHLQWICRLKVVNISQCHNLKYIFSHSLAQKLVLLEELRISYCDELEHIICDEKDEGGDIIVLHQLQFIILKGLKSLRSFGPTNCFVKMPSLKEFKVCRLTSSRSQQRVALQTITLEDVELRGFKEVLRNAKNLTMDRVAYQKNLIPNIDPQGLNELKFLTLRDGRELECLIDTTSDEGNALTDAVNNLVKLVIHSMTSLKMLCNGQCSKGTLQKLEKLDVYNCSELVSLSPALQNIKKVKVTNCDKLQHVFQLDMMLHDDSEENQAPLLSNLTQMELHSLPELQWIWKLGEATHYVNLQSLMILEISNCNRLQYLFTPSMAQSLVMLHQLEIDHCDGLQHIITTDVDDHLTPPLFPKLTTLDISDCPQLMEYVFQIPSPDDDEVLPQLQSIWIVNSPQLKHVFKVAKGKNIEVADCAIALPCLEELHLVNLINLSGFYSENHLAMLPSLKTVEAWDCPQLGNFNIQRVDDLQVKAKDVQILHGFKELFCNANSLTLNQVTYEKNLVANVDNGSELELDYLIDTEKLGHVSTNLEELVIEEMIGLKWIWKLGPRTHFVSLHNLKRLHINQCHRLVHLFSPSLARSLVVLEDMRISHCNALEHIIITTELEPAELSANLHPNLFLSKLTTLSISDCPRLEYVLQIPSTGEVLPQLQFIWVSNSPQLKQVFNVVKEKNEVDDDHVNAIVLPCLKELHLVRLINLRYFSFENYPTLLPSLWKLGVWCCPRLVTFTIQPEKLQELHLGDLGNDEECERNNLEVRQSSITLEGISMAYHKKVFHVVEDDGHNPSLRVLDEQSVIQISTFRHLQVLRVWSCNRIKSLFSLMLAQNLCELTYLVISQCEELEEIIEMDQTFSACSSLLEDQPEILPNLGFVKIEGCNNLKSLLPICSAIDNKLKSIVINGASKLEQVYGYDGEPDIDAEGIWFEELKELTLLDLPSLKRLSNKHFLFPELESLEVRGCPMLNTSFGKTSENEVFAATQDPQQIYPHIVKIQRDTAKSLTTMEEMVHDDSTCNDISWHRRNRPHTLPLYLEEGEIEDSEQKEEETEDSEVKEEEMEDSEQVSSEEE